MSKRIGQVFVRSQKSRGSGNGFGGPDTYVAIVWREEGMPEWTGALRYDYLTAHGYELQRVGEGYSEHSGPRSALGQAKARAQQLIAEAERVEEVGAA